MKLYLSSVGVPDEKALLSLLKPDGVSVAVIPNAWDVYSSGRKNKELEKTKQTFLDLNFKVSIVDLSKSEKDKIKEQLIVYDLLWVMGGNVFYLNELVNKSGLRNIIEDLLSAGVVYGGESAGAVLAGKTLHGIEYLDDSSKSNEVIWDGLNLLDSSMIPHWGEKKYTKLLEKCKNEMEKYSQVKTLANDQVLVIDNTTNCSIVLVNQDDEVIGSKARNKIDHINDIYRVSALWVTNFRGDILLAQRKLTKKHHPGKWGPAVAGTVEEGESYSDNIIKEAEEELGLTNINPRLSEKMFVDGKYKHFTQYYTLVLDKPAEDFMIEEKELEQVKWIPENELIDDIKKHPEKYLDSMNAIIEQLRTR